MIAEAAGRVVVLAMDVGGDHPADGHVLGPGHNGQDPSGRDRGRQQRSQRLAPASAVTIPRSASKLEPRRAPSCRARARLAAGRRRRSCGRARARSRRVRTHAPGRARDAALPLERPDEVHAYAGAARPIRWTVTARSARRRSSEALVRGIDAQARRRGASQAPASSSGRSRSSSSSGASPSPTRTSDPYRARQAANGMTVSGRHGTPSTSGCSNAQTQYANSAPDARRRRAARRAGARV